MKSETVFLLFWISVGTSHGQNITTTNNVTVASVVVVANSSAAEPLVLAEPLCDESVSFRCANSTDDDRTSSGSSGCIPKDAYCDGVWDCEQGSDELSCYFETCKRPQVLCSDKSACVSPLKICDGKYDCRDHSDEISCSNQRECENEGKIFCDTKLCISARLHCDGILDCADGTDENNCTCGEFEFMCANHECIPLTSRCDSSPDCTDKSDEMSCFRIDDNDLALTYSDGSWLPVCNNESSAESEGRRICQAMGYGEALATGSLAITTNSTNCSAGLKLSCMENDCKLKSSGSDAKTPQEIRSLLMVKSPTHGKSCKSQILSPLWLLSSHECLSGFSSLTNLTAHYNETMTFEIDDVVIHTHASKFRSLFIRDYDFVLLKLKDPIDLKTSGLNKICLPDQKVDMGITCFGVVSQDHEDIPFIVRDLSVCNEAMHYNGSVSERHICAESQNGITAIEVGSPLICLSSTSEWFLAGLLTYGHNSTFIRHPAVFSNIFSEKPFLENVMGSAERRLTYNDKIGRPYEVSSDLANITATDSNATRSVDGNKTNAGNSTMDVLGNLTTASGPKSPLSATTENGTVLIKGRSELGNDTTTTENSSTTASNAASPTETATPQSSEFNYTEFFTPATLTESPSGSISTTQEPTTTPDSDTRRLTTPKEAERYETNATRAPKKLVTSSETRENQTLTTSPLIAAINATDAVPATNTNRSRN